MLRIIRVTTRHSTATHASPTALLSSDPAKTEDDLQQLTFVKWLNYYLTHTTYSKNATYLLSDEQCFILLKYCTSGLSTIDEIVARIDLNDTWTGSVGISWMDGEDHYEAVVKAW